MKNKSNDFELQHKVSMHFLFQFNSQLMMDETFCSLPKMTQKLHICFLVWLEATNNRNWIANVKNVNKKIQE